MEAYSLQQTLDQARAKQAWEDVQEAKKDEGFRRKYGSLARKVPMMVLTNGLGQTLAFLCAKGKGDLSNEHMLLYNHLSRWVIGRVNSHGDLLAWVRRSDSVAYRRATTEALAYLAWLKRFAEAELPTEEE